MNRRTLKIEATGDFWNRRVKPRIRLCGQWLERAGFKPGQHVEVHLLKPGELTLQCKEQAPPLPMGNSPDGKRFALEESAALRTGELINDSDTPRQ